MRVLEFRASHSMQAQAPGDAVRNCPELLEVCLSQKEDEGNTLSHDFKTFASMKEEAKQRAQLAVSIQDPTSLTNPKP